MERHNNKFEGKPGNIPGKKWLGLLCSIIYGWIAKALFCATFSWGALAPGSGITTCSFLFLVPFVMGLILAWHMREIHNSRKTATALISLLAVTLLFMASILFQEEGSMYALIAFPVYGLMAVCGSITGRFLFTRKKHGLLLSALILLPFLAAPIESRMGRDEAIYTRYTTISIRSDNNKVWENITSVKAITEAENKGGLYRFTGVPRPVKAEFDTIAVGGQRKAFFDRGLVFTETITAMVPDQVLAFNIEADPGSKPVSALEKHLIIDGRYFEVLDGRYELEKAGKNMIKLHLSSRYRLATHFNFYSGWWAGIIMDRIQKSILQVVKQRSETGKPD